MTNPVPIKTLITGGTGYVGGRLITLLQQRGIPIRCLARRPQNLAFRTDAATEVVAGDVLQPDSLQAALAGIETAYYLVHSMGTGRDFECDDREGARNFAYAARQAGVKRIIYLGGLGEAGQQLSAHLRSRQEVGQVLAQYGAQVIEFRASIIIGSGSLSFEMIRSLVQKLPFMICPRWVQTPASPIAIEDVLSFLIAAMECHQPGHQVFEIGGPDQVTYRELMREYARRRGLKRLMISVPLLTPRLSSLWLGLVTPVYARIGRKLIESLRNPTIVHDRRAERVFGIAPLGVADAIDRALVNEDREFAETCWPSALSAAGRPARWGGQRFGNRLVDSRAVTVNVAAERAFEPIERIGGETGWYYGNGLWRLRGLLDLLVGGIGIRRGRRDPRHLFVGDMLDCWRVDAIDRGRMLRLSAEMKLPGRAWLEFTVTPETATRSTIRQTAIFDPLGLGGLMYWYSIYPLHGLVFNGMLQGLASSVSQETAPENSQFPAPDHPRSILPIRSS